MSFFKAIVLFCLFALGSAFAQYVTPVSKQISVDPVDSPMEWLEKSRRTMDGVGVLEVPEWLKGKTTDAAMQSAEKLKKKADVIHKALEEGRSVKQAVTEFKNPQAITSKKADSGIAFNSEFVDGNDAKSYIFVSQTMPEAELKSAMEESSESGATLIFRGIKPGQAIDHIIIMINKIVQKYPDLKPAAIMNPNLFTQYNINAVPATVVHLNGKWIKATGTMSVDYLLSLMEEDKQGDIGVVGPTFDIIEPDLIEELKRRTALLDWDELKKGAVDRFWTESWPVFNLPPAQSDNAFLIDPTFTLDRDIGGFGITVAKAGAKYNPQKILPLRQILFIFDATDEKQLKFVKEYITKNKIPFGNAMPIATELDRTKGFKALGDLEKYFGVKVYLVDKAIVDRFKIKVVPSIVAGSGDFYKVREFSMEKKK